MSEEKIAFTRRFLVYGNLGLLVWISLASASILFYNQLFGWLYLVLLFVVAYVVLRRLGCSGCYGCKACTGGFGRLAGCFFGRGAVKRGSVGSRVGIVVFMYMLLLPIPVVFIVLGGFSIASVFVLGFVVALSGYSLSTWYNN